MLLVNILRVKFSQMVIDHEICENFPFKNPLHSNNFHGVLILVDIMGLLTLNFIYIALK